MKTLPEYGGGQKQSLLARIFCQGYLWLLLLLLYSPIIIIMVFSFTESKVMGNWTGFSFRLYRNLFVEGTHHSLSAALVNTLTIALITGLASTLLGTVTAIGIHNLRSRARSAITFVNNIPILNGDIIIGISLFLLFVSLGIPQGYTTVVLAHISFCTPYVILSVMPRLKQMNPNMYEAAIDLGATPMQALRKIIIPEILPGMISGFMLAVTLSIDDFAITVFTIGNEGLETLSTFIYADARKGGLTPELRPLSTIIFVLVLVLLVLINRRSGRQTTAKQKAKSIRRTVRHTLTVLLAAVSLTSLTSCHNREPREEVLKVYNWADYIDEDMLARFPEWYRQQTGRKIRVIYQTFDINEIMLTKIERGHEDYDVVCPSEYIIERMLRKDLLLPIDTCFGRTPNYLHNLSPYIVEQMEQTSYPGRPAHLYAVAYMWGTAGILYNKQHVPLRDAQTWGTLWNTRYRGKLLMKDSYRDSYGTALIYAHRRDIAAGRTSVKQLMNDYSPAAIDTVMRYLKALKPNIEGWEADFGKETMTKGKSYLNMTWSGDAVWAIEEAEAVGVELGYEVPKEGSNVWFDGWVIPKYARNPKAAAYFINYLCQSQVALANMETTGYVSAVATGRVLRDMNDPEAFPQARDLTYLFGPEGRKAHLNPIMYPDSVTIARCAMIHDAGDHTAAVLDMWSKVKGDNLGGGLVFFLLAVIITLTVWAVCRKIRLRRHQLLSRRHRRHHVIRVKN